MTCCDGFGWKKPAWLVVLLLILVVGPSLTYGGTPHCRPLPYAAPFNPPLDGEGTQNPHPRIKKITIYREGQRKSERQILEPSTPPPGELQGRYVHVQMFAPYNACVGVQADFRLVGSGVPKDDARIIIALATQPPRGEHGGDPTQGPIEGSWASESTQDSWIRVFNYMPKSEGYHYFSADIAMSSPPFEVIRCNQTIYVAPCINGEWQSASRQFRVFQAIDQVSAKQIGSVGLSCGVRPEREFQTHLPPQIKNFFRGKIPVCNPPECVEAGFIEAKTAKAQFHAQISEDARTIKFKIDIDAYKVKRDSTGKVTSCNKRKKPEQVEETWTRVGPIPGLTGRLVPEPWRTGQNLLSGRE